MERDCDTCVFQVVPKSKFKLLLVSGRYDRKSKTVLISKEKLADGRTDFVVLDSEWERYERIEREVLAEVERVADDAPIVIEQPIPPSPQSRHDDGIPEQDRQEAEKYFSDRLPEHPESSRRPSWFREPLDPWGGR
jgi:hypothetical protein